VHAESSVTRMIQLRKFRDLDVHLDSRDGNEELPVME
jgi:hypothetical protein